MWKSGGAKPANVSPDPPVQRSRFRGAYRVLITVVVLFVALVLVFPILFAPRIDAPTDVKFGTASALTVQISNQNFTPLNDLEYDCELSKLTLANGSAINNAKVLVRGVIRKLPGRKAIAIHCESAYLVTDQLKAAEYQLTLKYRAYPWPKLRTSIYQILAQFNSSGDLTGWKSK
jgi:hypothetical protein